MKRVLQLFRVASVTTMGHTATLESTLLVEFHGSLGEQTPGTGTWAYSRSNVDRSYGSKQIGVSVGVLVIFELFDNFSI